LLSLTLNISKTASKSIQRTKEKDSDFYNLQTA
jgi:hypothetical protein